MDLLANKDQASADTPNTQSPDLIMLFLETKKDRKDHLITRKIFEDVMVQSKKGSLCGPMPVESKLIRTKGPKTGDYHQFQNVPGN